MSFLVEPHHWILKDPITLQFGDELFVQNERFVAALGNDGEVDQVFHEFLAITDRKNNCREVAVCVGEVLQGLANGEKSTTIWSECRGRAETPQR